jgi:hypothetical protein
VVNILAAPGSARTTRLWKPAIPLVTAMALLCAFSASQAPELVGVVDAPGPEVTATSVAPVVSPMLDAAQSAPAPSRKVLMATANARVTKARPQSGQARPAALFVPARYTLPQPQQRKLKLLHRLRAAAPREEKLQKPAQMIAASFSPGSADAFTTETSVSDQNGQVVFLFVTSQQVTAGSGTPAWRVKTVEVLWLVPENLAAKQIPNKI